MALALIASVVFLLPGPADAAGGKYALVVGVGDFLSSATKSNPGSVGDAVDVTTLLSGEGYEVRTLTDATATASAIRSGLSWLADKCDPGTDCALHYSGHVKQAAFNDGDSESLDEALWPYDGAFIPDGELASYLRQLKGRAWINISGCEAAGFNDSVASSNRLFTASSLESQKSYESPEWSNSIWTGLLVDQGMLQDQADANGDGHATLSEAFNWAQPRATEHTLKQRKGKQTPYMAGGGLESWFPSLASPSYSADLPAGPPPGRFCILFICL
ncbi:MAG: caspase family protein [Actinomycetota bacterium]